MKIYIKSAAAISPQPTFESDGLEELRFSEARFLKMVEPDYKSVLPAGVGRRMSKIMKAGIAAAYSCLRKAQIECPDAVITGTGMGCIEDTHNFLRPLIENGEQLLTPTAFIQSTHNTVGGLIAILLKCQNYNFTYVNRGFSFESALLDAILLIKNGEAKDVLAGGLDEITEDHYKVATKLPYVNKEIVNSALLYKSGIEGALAGEGTAFFLLSSDSLNAGSEIKGLKMIYNPDKTELKEKVSELLDEAAMKVSDLDLIISGFNGNRAEMGLYNFLTGELLDNKPVAVFKHLCGEYHTSSSFGLWIASSVLTGNTLPPEMMYKGTFPGKVKNILLVNNYQDYFTLILAGA